LALRALDEQERRVAELRGRLTPVLAAGGLAVTLLAQPALASGAFVVAPSLVALACSILSGTYLLLAGRLAFGVDAAAATKLLGAAVVWSSDAFYDAMIKALDRQRAANAMAIEGLQTAFTAMVFGMLLSVCGLAFAAGVA
ncbi:MAG: hypothetical protein WBC33_07750, partial [Conexibacter sp.]